MQNDYDNIYESIEEKKTLQKAIYRFIDFFLTRNSIPILGKLSRKIRCFLARFISKGIYKNATIEKGAIILPGVSCEPHGCIGINNRTCWGLHIGSNTMIGPNCCFFSTNHERAKEGNKVFVSEDSPRSIYIGPECWIGYGCIILGGVKIGEGSTIAAGSVVTHDIPPFCLAAGNPAIVKKYYTPPKGYIYKKI